MKTMKIYGMRGLLEWHGTVHSKGLKMKVAFTNGSVTAYGVAPATFITSDTLTQTIMENSDEFKRGRIRLERTVPLPDEKESRVAETASKAVAEPTPKQAQVENADAAAVEEPESETAETDVGVQKVKVADKAEAIEWLKENYPDKGYTAVKLRSTAAFETACQECNVKFEF